MIHRFYIDPTGVRLPPLVYSERAHEDAREFGLNEHIKSIDAAITEITGLPYTTYPGTAGARLDILSGTGANVEPHTEGYTITDFTAVLFLTTLWDDDGGELFVEGEEINPITGFVVAFPSIMSQWVAPLKSNTIRITLATIAGLDE